MTNDQLSYALTFRALELAAGAARLSCAGMHHRYSCSTPRVELRRLAAASLRAAREVDPATARKVWARHRPQIVPPLRP